MSASTEFAASLPFFSYQQRNAIIDNFFYDTASLPMAAVKSKEAARSPLKKAVKPPSPGPKAPSVAPEVASAAPKVASPAPRVSAALKATSLTSKPSVEAVKQASVAAKPAVKPIPKKLAETPRRPTPPDKTVAANGKLMVKKSKKEVR